MGDAYFNSTTTPFQAVLRTTDVARREGPDIKVKVLNTYGLHARPAATIVSVLRGFSSEVAITYRKKTANARSLLGLLMLGVPCGSLVTIKAWGPDAQEALHALETLFEKKFHEGGAE